MTWVIGEADFDAYSGDMRNLRKGRMFLSQSAPSPYKLFFPLGAVWALVGVGAWILHIAGFVPYPGSFHASSMIGGFVLSLAAGFLLTAVPKFTGARPCTNAELGLATLLLMGQLFCEKSTPGMFAFLLYFFGRRFRERQYSPPIPFLFVPLGLLMGLIGSLGIALGSAGVYAGSVVPFRAMFFQGMLLSLVVGIGARLIRVLLGYEPSPLVQIERSVSKSSVSWFRSETPAAVRLHVGLLALGFLLEFVPQWAVVGRLMRAWVVSWVAITAWRLYRRPPRGGALSWGLWASCWSLWLGSVAYPLAGVYGLHFLHLVFIGGFGTVALMVASRVVLAHGGHPVDIELRSRAILASWILALLGAVARLGAGFTGEGYFRHLLYAAVFFFAGVLVWTIWMLPKVFPGLVAWSHQPSLKGEVR